MKILINQSRLLAIMILTTISFSAMAQRQKMQYFRPNNQEGIHVFETTKNDTNVFRKMRVQVGGNFSQDFQAIKHQNSATPVIVNSVNTNQPASLKNGFNLAMANLDINAQLEDGVRMSLTMYLASRHHSETWVKGGYIQFDKLLFLKSGFIDKLMENITIKVGDYEVDYGDQHFRRSDGGNSIYNPFVENYIMDEFTTEIGGEVYYHHSNGFFAMVGVTNGELNPTVIRSSKIDTATGQLNKYSPAYHGKLGYDRQFNEDFRFRLTGSVYMVKSAASNTLFGGDRTGSHYFYVMENTAATASGNAFSGRYNPQFKQQVLTFMINPFVKFKGFEFFGTYEMAQGRTIIEPEMRTAIQYAADLIFRFPHKKENFWIGARYNSVTASLVRNPTDITITRMAGSLGWFITKNIVMKAEYVNQVYEDYKSSEIFSGGKFSGFMLQAAIGF